MEINGDTKLSDIKRSLSESMDEGAIDIEFNIKGWRRLNENHEEACLKEQPRLVQINILQFLRKY